MKITKLGHCCLLIEENSLRILTDPGAYSKGFEQCTNIDIILITHEHPDHFHIDSLKKVLLNSPDAKIITNASVGKLLDKENISYTLLNQGMKYIEDIEIEAFGEWHAIIYNAFPVVENTGYFIANKLFYPGDAFTNPMKHVKILAVPVNGPWVKISDAIDYALKIKPDVCFPVHDGNMIDRTGTHNHLKRAVSAVGIELVTLESPEEF